jgi:protein ImuB
MQRIACLCVPQIFLQHVLHTRPEWRNRPVVIVADARPTAPIVELNRAARALALSVGMGLKAAQAIAHDIEVEQFDAQVQSDCIDALWLAMLTLTPGVEPDPVHRGVLWLDPSGLDKLFQSLTLWGQAVQRVAHDLGFDTQTVIGFNRYLTHALARRGRGLYVLADPDTEAQQALSVGLEKLALSPALRDATALLGLRTLGDLLQFDASAIRQRLGPEAQMIYRMAKGHRSIPLRPKLPEVPCEASQALEPGEADLNRLLFVIKALLDPMLQQLVDRGEQIVALYLRFELERCAHCEMALTPAKPSCDSVLWMDLIRLRLNASGLAAPVLLVHVKADTAPAQTPQIPLLSPDETSPPKRDLAQAAQGLARLVAALGAESVTCAQLCPSHLPEKRFVWRACHTVGLPRILAPVTKPPLIRRVLAQPQRLAKGKLASLRVSGPYKLSQGWWHTRIERDYFYVETQDGKIIWLFHDLARRGWYVHGYAD